MKKYILLAVILTFVIMAQATIINVDNKANRPSGYLTNLQLAVTNASAGDTLYVYPSNISYGNINIKKQLYLFGSGYDGKIGTASKVDYFYLDTAATPSSNSSGTVIQGFTIERSVNCYKNNIKDIKITGNYFSYYGNNINLYTDCSGWVISNNYLSGDINISNNNTIVITNNVFKGNSYGIRTSNSSSIVISHNLFMNWGYLNNVQNATVSNNIFICNTGSYTGGTMNNNTFTNNISYCSNSSNSYTLPPTGNTGSGNLENQNPLFVTGSLSNNYDDTKDYHLQSSSPAINAASDGTDIGQYGGTEPFVWGKALTIPSVTEMFISNPIINQGTDINVNIKAKKADL